MECDMKPKYFCIRDDRQWILRVEKDAEDKVTKQTKRVQSVIGYFPKFHQAVQRMYEHMVADEVGVLEDIPAAVEKAKEVYENIAKTFAVEPVATAPVVPKDDFDDI